MRLPRWTALVVLLLVAAAAGCGPSRGSHSRLRHRRKLTPLVFKQHVPNVSENTLGAAGPSEKSVSRDDPRFRDLVPNYNSDIIFKDEEGTGEDRLMTQRCVERLNMLAISVMNQWPGVKLRVVEGWDEEHLHHPPDSLHYEGRAVDVTTSDRDRSKYGMLARLAIEAGFDWVYYESRSHIHCSVKSESSQAAKSGGCFSANSTVETPSGRRLISELRVGEMVRATDSSGLPVWSEVLLFLDRSPEERRLFLRVTTSSGRSVTLTPSHLVPVVIGEETTHTFAQTLRPGDQLVNGDRVASVEAVVETGVYAPLTSAGTIVVDGVVASCYAVVDSHAVAHWSFAPVRLLHNMQTALRRAWTLMNSPLTGWRSTRSLMTVPKNGVHWYAKMLYSVARVTLPKYMLYN